MLYVVDVGIQTDGYMGVIEVSMGITEQFRQLSIHEIEISLLNILAIFVLPSN